MKALLVLVLLSGSVFAEDYVCDVRNYRVELDLRDDTSTSMWLTDLNNHETIAQGYAGSIEKKGDKSVYHFYPGNAEPMNLTFKTEDAVNFPEKINGRIETKARGFLLWENISCRRRN